MSNKYFSCIEELSVKKHSIEILFFYLNNKLETLDLQEIMLEENLKI